MQSSLSGGSQGRTSLPLSLPPAQGGRAGLPGLPGLCPSDLSLGQTTARRPLVDTAVPERRLRAAEFAGEAGRVGGAERRCPGRLRARRTERARGLPGALGGVHAVLPAPGDQVPPRAGVQPPVQLCQAGVHHRHPRGGVKESKIKVHPVGEKVPKDSGT